MYDLLPDETQDAIIASAREAAQRLDAATDPDAAWQAVAASGVIGLAVPDELGGAGLGATEQVLALIELGAARANPSVLASVLAAHYLVAQRPDGDPSAPPLDGVLDGRVRIAFAVPWSSTPVPSPTAWRTMLPTAATPAWCLASDEETMTLAPLPAGAAVRSIDPDVPQTRVERLDGAAPAVLLPAMALLGCAALQVGLARAALERSVDYAKLREQFGRPIGSFQAVKHQLAAAAVEIDAASATLLQAAVNTDVGVADNVLLRSAAALADRCALSAVRTAIQVHGGIGVTEESGLHLLLRRAHMLGQLFGPADYQDERILVATIESATVQSRTGA